MRLNNDRQFTFLTTAVSQSQQYLDSTSQMSYTTRREALSHMDAICRVVEFNKRDCFSEACVTFGTFYADQGRLVDAEAMYNRALARYEKALGPEHTSTLLAVNNLGNLYANQGRLVDAEAMYNRVNLAICRSSASSSASDISQVVQRLRAVSFVVSGSVRRYCQNSGVSCMMLRFRASYCLTKVVKRSCRLEIYART
jgi:tetratricopeptide (TPR) repeat protein